MKYENAPVEYESVDPSTQLAVFGGKKAQGWVAEIAKKLEEAKANKMSPLSMWRRYGVMRGVDDQPRFEIPDHNAKLLDDPEKITGQEFGSDMDTGLAMGDLLEHPRLYEQYPELRDLEVGFSKDMYPGAAGEYYNTGGGSVGADPYVRLLAGKPKEESLSTLLHEVQHYLQDKEGFARGANSSYWRDPAPLESEAERMFSTVREARLMKDLIGKYGEGMADKAFLETVGYDWNPSSPSNAYLKYSPEELRKLSDIYLKDYKRARLMDRPGDLYHKSAGEVEARNVQRRAKGSPFLMRDTHPRVTEDVDWIDQILLKGNVK